MASATKSKERILGIGFHSTILNYENVVKEMQTVIEKTARRR
ncbi:MAG: hypothetical protein ACFFH0_05460 [Promethearchaeota archaeon]